MISTIKYFGMIAKENIKRYNECKKIVSKIIKRQRRKNVFDKTELMLVVAANLERHKLNHNCRKNVGVLDTNCKRVYTPTIKLQRGLRQFKINGANVSIEPTVNRRKCSEDVFFEALESWNEKLKEEVEKTTELNETTIKTPVNVMSDTSIITYYDLKEYGSDNRTRFNINGDMNYEFNKEV